MRNEEKFKQNEKVTWMGAFSNVMLTALKAAAALLGRSEAMLAEAVNSASDVVAMLIALVGLRIAKKPRDENHPYGHGKVEAIVEVTIALFIIAAGAGIVLTAYRSIVDIIEGVAVSPNWVALGVALLTIAVKGVLYRYAASVAGRTMSPSVRASAMDHLSDAFSASTAAVGVAGAMLGLPILDPIAGIAVSGFIFHTGYRVLRSGLMGLMDTAARNEIVSKMEAAAMSVPGVISFHKLYTRYVGSSIMADVHIQVDPSITVAEGHDIATMVRSAIVENVDGVWDVLVHTEPSNPPWLSSDPHGRPSIQDRQNRIEDGIKVAVEGIEGMKGFHDIRVNISGDKTLVDIDVEVDANASVAEGHQIAEEVERAIYKKFDKDIDDVQVHVDPREV
jgi:cation diffusion facilitator family transporter